MCPSSLRRILRYLGSVGGFLLFGTIAVAAQPMQAEAWQWPGRELPTAISDTLDSTPADEWFAGDKAMHVGISFLMTLSAQYVYENNIGLERNEAIPLSIASSLSAGIAKEVMDSNRDVDPHFSAKDLVADLLGTLLAVGLIVL